MKNVLIGAGILVTLVAAILLAKTVGVFFALCVGLALAILVGAYYMGWLDWAFGAVTSSGRGRTALIIVVVYFVGFLGLALFEAGSRMYMAHQNTRNEAADQAAKHDATNITFVDVMPEAAYNSISQDVDDELKKGDDMNPSLIVSYRRSMVQALDGFLPALADSVPEYALGRINKMLAHEDSLGAYRDSSILHALLVYKARAVAVFAAQSQAKASGKSASLTAAPTGVGLVMQTKVGNRPFRFDAWTGLGTAPPEQPAVRDTVRITLPGTIVRDTVVVREKTIVVTPGTIKPAPPSCSSLILVDTLATPDNNGWESAPAKPFQSPR